MDSDGPTKKYNNMYEFFKRVAIQAAEYEQLSKAAKKFSASFGGSVFEQSERNHRHPLADTALDKEERTSGVAVVVTNAATIHPPIPYRKWTPRVAVMESVQEEEEDNDENVDPYVSSNTESESLASIKVMTASERLSTACYKMVSKNSCNQVNCEYSHDKAIVAAARDKTITDLMAVKRGLQDHHQNTMKVFEKAGAKSFKPTSSPVTFERRPVTEQTSPRISLLQQPLGPQLNEEIGREAECFRRVAAMTQRFPVSILKHGCQTEVTILGNDRDINVRTTLDTGCCPGNYMKQEYFDRNVEALGPFLVPSVPERVDLATNGSSQQVTAHVNLDIRHVDSHGNMRLMKLKFGILQGLRFDVVIGLYAISIHFMDVMRDLLAVQLEFLESGTQKHCSVLHGQVPQLLTLSSDDHGAQSN